MSATPPSPDPRGTGSVHERINRITAALHVSKDGRMSGSGGNYNYVRHEDVVGLLKELLTDEKVVILPVDAELLSATEYKTAAGKLGRHFVLKVSYVTYATNKPEEVIRQSWICENADTSDKAIQKALTNGEKYLLMKTFKVVEGGEDADGVRPEEGVVYEQPRRDQAIPAAARPAQAQGSDSPAELAQLLKLATSMARPWSEVTLKARLKQFGFEKTKADMIAAGAIGEIEPTEPGDAPEGSDGEPVAA